jgi:hypothetical protein
MTKFKESWPAGMYQENSPGPEGARAENGTRRRNYASITMHTSCLKNKLNAIMELCILAWIED